MVYHYGMYWGHSLLDGVGDSIAAALKRPLYALVSMLSKVLYQIWHLLAWIVNGIEKIFRNLAGLGENGDIVSDIVNNPKVSQIFRNMVGLATALIIFFTIIKIIQDHYKEKDGGNPYKIVIRTFKGLLMFFFVNAAVVVGLYASGVMFRALDAATGTGSASIAGQAFKAMAAESNFTYLGRETGGFFDDVRNEYYWAPVASGDTDKGRYFLLEFSGNNDKKKATGKALAARYAEKFPATKYEIVNDDGTATPFANWLKTEGALDNQMDTPTSYNSENGSTSATAGYQNDLLRGIDCNITPSIDLTWSPIDIDNYPYSLKGTKTIEHNIQLLVMGSGILIPMSTQLQKFFPGQRTTKSLEDSAKMFGINVSGGVSLQDGAASASFNMDETMGFGGGIPKWSEKFGNIMTTILLNVVYTNTLMYVVQMIPEIPGAMTIGPISISFVQMLAPMLTGVVKNAVNNMFSSIIPRTETGEPAVEMFSDGATDHNGAVWCIMNARSNTLDTVIEQYRVDGNFSDLWGQLMANINELRAQLEQANLAAFIQAAEENLKVTNAANRIQEQQPWQSWLGVVNEYNKRASELLQRLGNLLKLHDEMLNDPIGSQGGASAKTYLSNRGYSGDFSDLKSDIKTTFVNLVALYQNNINGKRPTNSYADVIVTRPVYKPIVEFGITEAYASSLKESDSDFVSKVKDVLFGEGTRINLVMDTNLRYSNSNRAAYRVVDWEDSYGYMYVDGGGAGLRNVADIYYEGQADAKNKSAAYTREQLQFMNMDRLQEKSTGKINWDKNGGVRYFAENNKGNSGSLLDNSYWGTDGVYVNGEKKYYYYEGTTYRPVKHGLDGATMDDDEVGDDESEDWYVHLNQNTVRLSTASVNETTSTALKSQSNLIDELTTVDKSTSLAKNFRNEIVTFRKIGTAKDEDGEDGNKNKAKKSWIENHDKVKANGDFSTMEMTHNMTANEIDDYMAGSVKGDRRYLIKTVEGTMEDAKADQSNWGDYIGEFTWQNVKSVGCLYNFPSMNYAVGFITIIAALGVYMNFAFALIQRAVNMAVLYMMSPITIAFYPFDDGSKFNSVFVKPFYNEAISAFAVIVSLNLFIVLMQPLESAVKNVAGTGMGWLALVAFVSMLPQVRNTVYSVLGGSKMSEKSLTDTFKAAKGAIGSSFSDFKNAAGAVKKAGKSAAHGIDKVRQAKNAIAAKKQSWDEQRLADLKAKQAENGGKLSWLAEQRLNKLDKRSALRSQSAIDNARDKVARGVDKNEAYKGLSKSQIRRLERQDSAAQSVAKKNLAKLGVKANDPDYKNKLAAEQKKLLTDAKFKKSVNGVVASKLKGTKVGRGIAAIGKAAAAPARGVGKLAGLSAKGLKHAGSWVANTSAGKLAKDIGSGLAFKAKTSIAGELLSQKYGRFGTASENKDSFVGAIWRSVRADVNEREMDRAGAKYRADEAKRRVNNARISDAVTQYEKWIQESQETVRTAAKHDVAMQEFTRRNLTTQQKVEDLKVEEFRRQGMTLAAAKSAAAVWVNDPARTPSQLNEEYARLGGDQKYVDGIAKGWKELGIQLNFDDPNIQDEIKRAESKFQMQVNLGADNLGQEIKKKKEAKEAKAGQYADEIARSLNLTDEKDKKVLTNILSNATSTTTREQLVSAISQKMNLDSNSVAQTMQVHYSGYANDVQYAISPEIEQLELAQKTAEAQVTAMEKFNSKIGANVSAEEKAQILEVWNNTYDTNEYSSNPNSFGAQKHKIILAYEQRGMSANSAECQEEIANLMNKMKVEAGQQLQAFINRNNAAISAHNVAKKYKEEMLSVDTVQMMDERQHQREMIMNVDMDYIANDTLIRDNMLRKMHEKGDYAGAGEKLQKLILDVQEHNWDEVESSGFDEATIANVKQWEADGTKESADRLRGIMNLGRFDAANMGNTAFDMGGSTLMGMENALAQLTRVAEMGAYLNKQRATLNAFSAEEGEARTVVKHVDSMIQSTFNNAAFVKEFAGKITDASGKPITNGEELVAALRKNLDEANNSNDNLNKSWIKNNMQVLDDFLELHYTDPAYKEMIDSIKGFQNGMDRARFANTRCDDMAIIKTNISQIGGELGEITSKIKAYTENKK